MTIEVGRLGVYHFVHWHRTVGESYRAQYYAHSVVPRVLSRSRHHAMARTYIVEAFLLVEGCFNPPTVLAACCLELLVWQIYFDLCHLVRG